MLVAVSVPGLVLVAAPEKLSVAPEEAAVLLAVLLLLAVPVPVLVLASELLLLEEEDPMAVEISAQSSRNFR